ncbi:MAG: hypothetical protein JWP75_521 [Frondihabitans sp.]|nr:hypothetical protein [Frondihabitans sp.]
MALFLSTDRTALHGATSVLPARPRGVRRSRAVLAMVVASAVVASGVILGSPLAAQAATSYPSWGDVAAAAKSQDKKSTEIRAIEKLISQLKSDVTTKQAEAAARGKALQQAQLNFDQQEKVKAALQAKADAADKIAKASEVRAGQLAAQLGRSGSNDISTNLLTDPGKAGNLLYKLGAMSKLTEQASAIYATAVQDRNTAQGSTDQAVVDAKALNDLANQAQTALVAAQAATEAAQAAVSEQNSNQDRLTAQLASIKSHRSLTEAAYNKGVVIRRAQEAAAAKRAAAAAEKASGLTGVPSSSGWTKPAGGYITSGYGMRWDPATHVYQLHAGTDLGASCGSPILAAHSGTVIYAGPYGGYGNFILLDNGAGINTGYGHIVDGGIMVSVGQTVTVGQQIARVGSTGWSTGCHLHFETRVNTVATDAVPFMAARGVTL